MEKRHVKYNITYQEITPSEIKQMAENGLFDEIANIINSANRHLAELNFYYCSAENKWQIPSEFQSGNWPTTDDYKRG